MKKLFVGIIALAVMFASCDTSTSLGGGGETENGTLVGTFMLGSSPENLKNDSQFTIGTMVMPPEAPQGVTWEVEQSVPNLVIYYEPEVPAGSLTVVANNEGRTGTITITATTVGLQANGQPATATRTVAIVAELPPEPLHWHFRDQITNINGVDWGGNPQNTNAELENGLTLLAANRSMDWEPASNHAIGRPPYSPPHRFEATIGAIRPQGTTAITNPFARIESVQGPFELVIHYHAASATTERWIIFSTDGGATFERSTGTSQDRTGSDMLIESTFLYLGDGEVDVTLGVGGGGLRIFDIRINPLDPNDLYFPVTGVTLNHDEYLLDLEDADRQTVQLTATVQPSFATEQGVAWESSDTGVATVVDGLVTAVGDGIAIITVETIGFKDDGTTRATATVEITVVEGYVYVIGVTLNTTAQTINRGATFELIPTVQPSNATTQGVTWRSSNIGVATVGADGIVTAHAIGTTTITVTTEGLRVDETSATAEAVITVTATESNLPLHWNFHDPHPDAIIDENGDPWYASNANRNVNAHYMYGLVLLAGQRPMSWRATQNPDPAPDGVTHEFPSTQGAIQFGGPDDQWFARIEGVQGPFRLALSYNAGTNSLPARRLTVSFDGGATVIDTSPTLQDGTSGSNRQVEYIVSYAGSDVITVLLGAIGGVRVNDIRIVPLDLGNIPVTGVTLNHTEYLLDLSDDDNLTVQLNATVQPAHATERDVTWSTSDINVATVVDGLVTAVGDGIAVITATSVGFKADGTTRATATAEITVVAGYIDVTGVTLNTAAQAVNRGADFQLVATVEPGNATTRGVTWRSSNIGVATVDADGLVTAHALGTATITVTAVGLQADGEPATAEAVITVAATESNLPLHWDFRNEAITNEQGVLWGGNPQDTNAHVGNGLVLLGTNRTMDWNRNQNPLAGDRVEGVHRFPATQGEIRPQGGTPITSPFARIEGVQGPFDLVLNYNARSDNNQQRWIIISTDGGATSTDSTPTTNNGEPQSNRQVEFVFRYEGTGVVTITLGADGGLGINDIRIVPIESNGDIPDPPPSLPLHWDFRDPIVDVDGDTWGGNPQNTNADLGNGLTVLAANRTMDWEPNQNPLTGDRIEGAHRFPATQGAIRPGGGTAITTPFVRIENVQGPFELILNYNAGSDNNTQRWIIISTDGGVTSTNSTQTTNNGEQQSNRQVESTFRYEGTGVVTVTLGVGGGGLRLHDIRLEPLTAGD